MSEHKKPLYIVAIWCVPACCLLIEAHALVLALRHVVGFVASTQKFDIGRGIVYDELFTNEGVHCFGVDASHLKHEPVILQDHQPCFGEPMYPNAVD